MEEQYDDYINVLAFQCLYQYENKKSINADKLVEFRKRATNIMGDVITINRVVELKKIKKYMMK